VQDRRDLTRFRDLTLAEFIERLASPEPSPGGGSAAAVAASLGAALVTMVATLSIGRERYAQHSANLEEAATIGRELAARLLVLAEDDAQVYGRYAAALKLPRDTDALRDVRAREIADAARGAAEVPLATLRACLDLAAVAERLAGRSNVHAASDLTVAGLLATAAAQAAGTNVVANLPAVNDPDWSLEATRTVIELQGAVADIARMTRETVGEGAARLPIGIVASEAQQVTD
jgi:formiminotetrahydrofolate cyclodeaminase